MREGAFSHRRLRRFDGAEADSFPRYDLVRAQRRRGELVALLNALSRSIFDDVEARFRNLFHQSRVALSAGDWAIAGAPVAKFWLRACLPQRPEEVAWLGFDGAALSVLSDLFFGHDSSATRPRNLPSVSDTEERIAKRVLVCQLEAIASAFGLPCAGWEVRWDEAGPTEPLPGCSVTLSAETLKCGWSLCWSTSAVTEESAAPGPEAAAALEQAVLRVPVRLRVEVARLQVPLGRLEGLRPGDVLPLRLHSEAPARVGGFSCSQGRVAEDGDALVFQITKVFGQNDDA
jgi:flagellar motor switch protein FliM